MLGVDDVEPGEERPREIVGDAVGGSNGLQIKVSQQPLLPIYGLRGILEH